MDAMLRESVSNQTEMGEGLAGIPFPAGHNPQLVHARDGCSQGKIHSGKLGCLEFLCCVKGMLEHRNSRS